jgi:hypothetical protein
MKNHLKNIILTGVAGALLAPALNAATVNLVEVGGNASIKLVQNRVPTILTGATLTTNPTNSLIFRYTGTYAGNSVIWDFNLTGGAVAINDIANQNPVTLADNSTGIPKYIATVTAPETVGVDSTPFQQDFTLVAPLVYVKNPNATGNSVAGITNLTQRQAILLEQSGGTLPTAFFGGNPASNNIPGDALYFVGRNGSAAVRQVFDANIYFSGSAQNFTTNPVVGQPPVLWDGAGSGTEVANIVKLIPNSIGTVAVQDATGLPQLSYEGVAFSTTNVINGSYPIWGYERYLYYPSGSKAPSANQLALIQALETAVEDPTFQADTTKPFYGKFVSYAAVNASVYRDPTVDGSLILSNVY